MKYKNIKNKPKKCGRWLFLHSRFSKIFPGPPPPPTYKGNTSIKPAKSFFNNNKQPKAKKPESPPPLKQSTRNLSLGHTETEKRRTALGQYLFCVTCNCLKLICAISSHLSPLTLEVIGAPQMTLQQYLSVLPCLPLPSGNLQTPFPSIP